MNLLKTGSLIAELRCEKKLTQRDIADKLGVSPKTISKWETGHGFPDMSLVSPLSEILGVDISKLIEGELSPSSTVGSNVRRTKFYFCKNCGNMITATGKADITCCGRKLLPLEAKSCDKEHEINIEFIEDDFYITFPHSMTKEHYICFVSYVRFDRVLTVRLYPEQNGEVRFPRMRGGKLYFCCNTHGIFEIKI